MPFPDRSRICVMLAKSSVGKFVDLAKVAAMKDLFFGDSRNELLVVVAHLLAKSGVKSLGVHRFSILPILPAGWIRAHCQPTRYRLQTARYPA